MKKMPAEQTVHYANFFSGFLFQKNCTSHTDANLYWKIM